MTDPENRWQPLLHFYDTHPINESQILQALASDGVALDTLAEDTLKRYDQDHFGGAEAVDRLAEKAALTQSDHVLDVCSGLGGPARYLAQRHGCRVTGLDLTASRHQGAIRLTKLVKLDHLVDFQLGNALAMPFADATFDVVIGQEAWAHIPDKPRLIGECARVIKPGGRIAFTDILRRESLNEAEAQRLRSAMTFNELASLDGYARLLAEAGFSAIETENLSGYWTEILIQRLAMYRGLKEPTVAKFGADHYRRWDETYSFFVGLYAEHKLAGGRFSARRGTQA